jgi:ABC-type phosphate/phosphonate transport system ATPase subunit
MAQQNRIDRGIAPNIDVKNLSYAFPDGSSGLKDVFLQLPPGSRTLLIGGMLSLSSNPSFLLHFDGTEQRN